MQNVSEITLGNYIQQSIHNHHVRDKYLWFRCVYEIMLRNYIQCDIHNHYVKQALVVQMENAYEITFRNHIQ